MELQNYLTSLSKCRLSVFQDGSAIFRRTNGDHYLVIPPILGNVFIRHIDKSGVQELCSAQTLTMAKDYIDDLTFNILGPGSYTIQIEKFGKVLYEYSASEIYDEELHDIRFLTDKKTISFSETYGSIISKNENEIENDIEDDRTNYRFVLEDISSSSDEEPSPKLPRKRLTRTSLRLVSSRHSNL